MPDCTHSTVNVYPALDVKFCPECGVEIEKSLCPNCNAYLLPATVYCVSCGVQQTPAPQPITHGGADAT